MHLHESTALTGMGVLAFEMTGYGESIPAAATSRSARKPTGSTTG